jgi:hypothetical protein
MFPYHETEFNKKEVWIFQAPFFSDFKWRKVTCTIHQV